MKYEVEITRVSYSTLTFGVEADSKEQAEKLAMERACNTGWDEDGADYEVNSCNETGLTDEEWAEEFGA